MVRGTASELKHISILNVQGQDVTPLSRKIANSATQKEIDLSQLSAGFYVIRTATTSATVVKQ